jgi:hypothetical protein
MKIGDNYLVEVAIASIENDLDGNIGSIFDSINSGSGDVKGNAECSSIRLLRMWMDKLTNPVDRKVIEGVGVWDS